MERSLMDYQWIRKLSIYCSTRPNDTENKNIHSLTDHWRDVACWQFKFNVFFSLHLRSPLITITPSQSAEKFGLKLPFTFDSFSIKVRLDSDPIRSLTVTVCTIEAEKNLQELLLMSNDESKHSHRDVEKWQKHVSRVKSVRLINYVRTSELHKLLSSWKDSHLWMSLSSGSGTPRASSEVDYIWNQSKTSPLTWS